MTPEVSFIGITLNVGEHSDQTQKVITLMSLTISSFVRYWVGKPTSNGANPNLIVDWNSF